MVKSFKRKVGKKVVRKSYKKKMNLAKVVKSVISKQVEIKSFQYYQSGISIYPSNATAFVNAAIPLSPYPGWLQIAQGVGQGNRVGNKITLKKVSCSLVISPNPYNVTTNTGPDPTNVIVWFFYDRGNPNSLPVPGNDFLELGNSNQALTNSLVDCIAPVNECQYHLFARKVFKVGFAGYAGTGANAAYQSNVNNDYNYNVIKTFDVTKYCLKNVLYDDAGATPNQRGVYMLAQAVSATGSSLPATIIPAKMSISLSVDYTDL